MMEKSSIFCRSLALITALLLTAVLCACGASNKVDRKQNLNRRPMHPHRKLPKQKGSTRFPDCPVRLMFRMDTMFTRWKADLQRRCVRPRELGTTT